MSDKGIHFIFDPGKDYDGPFGRELVKELGQTPIEGADTVVTIGGDGMLMHAFRLSAGKKVAGLVSPGSSSIGFWTNKGIASADDLTELLNKAASYPVKPLQADISFANRESVMRYAYNEVVIRPVYQEPNDELKERYSLPDIDVSVQSALLKLRIVFDDSVICPKSLMGSGLILATPIGSTAMNRNFGGPSVDIRNDSIILTGIGTANPVGGFSPVVNHADTVFTIDIESKHKRPVIITYDSFGVVRNENKNPVESVRVSMAKDKAVNLVLKDNPGRRAYAAIID